MWYNNIEILKLENSALTKQEELQMFSKCADEFIDSKYILADIKIMNLLKSIAQSETLVALFRNCLKDFDFESAKKKYLVKADYMSDNHGEFIIPPNSRELLSFVFRIEKHQ